MLKYKDFTILKIDEKTIGDILYYDIIVIFDKFTKYIFEITNIHFYNGKLVSTLNIFLNKGNELDILSEESKEFERMKKFIQNFLRKYFMEKKCN
ncbi:hypothetical protein [Flavobacterium sp.]|uniref:hypothetical protein n=1 Tax=Flavobacterium sp. TaxID=239 RepID=UPI00262028B0|nr:hypothetical protein [Flavobacterium sp.]